MRIFIQIFPKFSGLPADPFRNVSGYAQIHRETAILSIMPFFPEWRQVQGNSPEWRKKIYFERLLSPGTGDRKMNYVGEFTYIIRIYPDVVQMSHPLISCVVSAYRVMLAQIWVLSDPVPFSDRCGSDLGGLSTPRSGPCPANISPSLTPWIPLVEYSHLVANPKSLMNALVRLGKTIIMGGCICMVLCV
jgi:hypothetical protein